MIRAVSAPVRLLTRRSRHVAAVREHKTSTQLTSMEPFNPFAVRICRGCLLVQPRDVSRGSVICGIRLFLDLLRYFSTWFDEAGRQVETKTGMVRLG